MRIVRFEGFHMSSVEFMATPDALRVISRNFVFRLFEYDNLRTLIMNKCIRMYKGQSRCTASLEFFGLVSAWSYHDCFY
jgi:hypothetical protein